MLWISLLDTLSRFSQNCFRRPSILTTISLAWMGHWLGTDLILPLISLLKGKLTLDQRMDEHEKWRSKYFLWVLSVPILWLLWVLRLSLKIRKDEKTIFWSSQREFNTYSYFFQHLEKPAQAWKKKNLTLDLLMLPVELSKSPKNLFFRLIEICRFSTQCNEYYCSMAVAWNPLKFYSEDLYQMNQYWRPSAQL